MHLKSLKKRGLAFYFLLSASILLVIGGVLMLAQTFTYYNELSLERQDRQLQDMAEAADESIAIQLNNLRADLSYVLGRRGFLQAEAEWMETGRTEELLFRMQENLVAQNPLIQTMLAIRDGEIVLSTDGITDYEFPVSREETLQPCFGGDGTMYLALMAQTAQADYAALINVASWYTGLARISGGEDNRLMLLGSWERLLLHQWTGGTHVTSVETLNESNCDVQAVRYMLESRNTGQPVNATYRLTYPEDDTEHELRIVVIPAAESANGYFIVGLASDYDEIIRPMQSAAIQLIAYGGMVIVGVLLLLFMALSMVRQGHQQDQELQRLAEINAQTQALLERTQELAHHQRLETLGTLTASIAHEFNNLLTPIMGYAILTLEGLPEDADDLADNVTEIYEASRKAKTIISRLSDLSRRNVEMTFRRLCMDDLVCRAMEVAAPAQPARVETVIRLNCADYAVMGNETQLSQLLLNLILNAFHAMEEQGGTLTLSTEAADGALILRAADTGIGIAPETLPHIFEPFFTTKESGRGVGLGLAIVQQVTQSHHGQVEVDSAPGHGTVFTLRFPLAASDGTGES